MWQYDCPSSGIGPVLISNGTSRTPYTFILAFLNIQIGSFHKMHPYSKRSEKARHQK